MKKDNGNGKGEALEIKSELNELKNFIHSDESLDKAFKSNESLNAMRLMVLSDEGIIDNAMRYHIPSYRVMMAIALSVQRCVKHDYTQGIEFYRLLLAMMPARRGHRIDQLIDAISGERRWQQGGDKPGALNNMKEKFKSWASV